MLDRAQQALHLLALETVAETTADPNSCHFEPMRACRDAAEQCFAILHRRGRAPWVLDADISSCWVKIKISEEGLGIAEEELPMEFQRFFRATTSTGIAGTGIELNLAHQIVELHGGQIDVESALNVGTTFKVALPLGIGHRSEEG